MFIVCVCMARHKYSYIGAFRSCSFGSAFAVLNYLQITPQTRPSRPSRPGATTPLATPLHICNRVCN